MIKIYLKYYYFEDYLFHKYHRGVYSRVEDDYGFNDKSINNVWWVCERYYIIEIVAISYIINLNWLNLLTTLSDSSLDNILIA